MILFFKVWKNKYIRSRIKHHRFIEDVYEYRSKFTIKGLQECKFKSYLIKLILVPEPTIKPTIESSTLTETSIEGNTLTKAYTTTTISTIPIDNSKKVYQLPKDIIPSNIKTVFFDLNVKLINGDIPDTVKEVHFNRLSKTEFDFSVFPKPIGKIELCNSIISFSDREFFQYESLKFLEVGDNSYELIKYIGHFPNLETFVISSCHQGVIGRYEFPGSTSLINLIFGADFNSLIPYIQLGNYPKLESFRIGQSFDHELRLSCYEATNLKSLFFGKRKKLEQAILFDIVWFTGGHLESLEFSTDLQPGKPRKDAENPPDKGLIFFLETFTDESFFPILKKLTVNGIGCDVSVVVVGGDDVSATFDGDNVLVSVGGDDVSTTIDSDEVYVTVGGDNISVTFDDSANCVEFSGSIIVAFLPTT